MTNTIQPLHVGLCRVDTGADGNRVGPADIEVSSGVLSISGTFMNADATPGSPEAIEAAQVFVQQWLGLADIPRTDLLRSNPIVPIWGSGRLGVDGMWRPLETGVSMLPGAVTTSQGAVRFSGRFERVAGGNITPVVETTIMRGLRVAARPTDVAVFDCAVRDQEVAKPNGMQLDGSSALLDLLGLDGVPTGTQFLDLLVPDLLADQDVVDGVVVNPTFTTSHRVMPSQFLNGRPVIEYETGGIGSGRWYRLIGRQFPPEIIPDRLRLSNGTVRVTLSNDGLRPLVIESYDAPTFGADTVARWREARPLRLYVYDSGGDGDPDFLRAANFEAPNLIPRVTRNDDGGVGVRVVLDAANYSSRPLDIEVGKYLPLVTMRYDDDDQDGSRSSLHLLDFDDQTMTAIGANALQSTTQSDDKVVTQFMWSRTLPDGNATGFSPLGRFAVSAACGVSGDSPTSMPTQVLVSTADRFNMFNAASVYTVEVVE